VQYARTFVVTDIEPIPNLFAYIDNVRVRTPATALQTAGYDGVASAIVRVIKIAEEVRHGIYNPTGATKLMRMSPIDVLGLVNTYPNAQKATRSAASDWDTAVIYLGGRKDVVAYLGMRIMDVYGEELADDFFQEVADDAERPADNAIAALRKEIDRDNRAVKPMKRQHILAALIKAFNAWHRGESLGRRWMLQVNEDFPALDVPEAPAVAAE